MAGDLEANKKDAAGPKLSNILKVAQRKVLSKNDSAPKLRERREEERISADDFLPIEETAVETKTETNEADKTDQAIYREPPDNLPTGEERPGSTARKTPFPQISEKERGKTPEEILGLPARIPPTVRRAPFTPLSIPQKETSVSPLPPPAPSPAPSISTSSTGQEKAEPKILPTSKFVVIAGGLSILLVSLVGAAYWAFFIKKAPPSVVEPSVELQPPKIIEYPQQPKALIQYDKERSITINELSYAALKLNIDALKDAQDLPGSMSYIPIRHAANYLKLKEFFNTLEIPAPPSIVEQEKYNIFLYSQKTNAQDECTAVGIRDAACWGPRIGIIMEIGGQNTDPVRASMRQWEETISEDISSIILSDYRKPENATFRTGNYAGTEIRFLNLLVGGEGLPIPTTSIDWLITNNNKYLIISTSKDTTRAAISGLAD